MSCISIIQTKATRRPPIKHDVNVQQCVSATERSLVFGYIDGLRLSTRSSLDQSLPSRKKVSALSIPSQSRRACRGETAGCVTASADGSSLYFPSVMKRFMRRDSGAQFSHRSSCCANSSFSYSLFGSRGAENDRSSTSAIVSGPWSPSRRK